MIIHGLFVYSASATHERDSQKRAYSELTTVWTFPSIFRRLESITAIRPRAAHFSKGSTKRGAVGSNWESSGGLSTLAPPVFLDCFQRILVIRHATLAVREKMIGQYPALRTPGCSWTATPM